MHESETQEKSELLRRELPKSKPNSKSDPSLLFHLTPLQVETLLQTGIRQEYMKGRHQAILYPMLNRMEVWLEIIRCGDKSDQEVGGS